MSETRTRKGPTTVDRKKLIDAALPVHAENSTPPDEVSRRRMLKLMAGTSAALLVGTQGCERKPQRKIISRVSTPEYQKPGEAVYYSSTWTEGQWPYGVVIKTVDGRPVKLDGNPDHPVSRGKSTPAMQASMLSLYDPDRLKTPTRQGHTISWEEADRQVVEALGTASSVMLITRSTLGPAERELVNTFLATVPGASHVVHETVDDTPRRSAWKKIYGAEGELLPLLDRARIVLSLDADFLADDGAVLENIAAFARTRSLKDDDRQAETQRLYSIESMMTLTGSNADHRLRLRASHMAELADVLRRTLGGADQVLTGFAKRMHLDDSVLEALVHDMKTHQGEAVVLAGGHLPEAVHAAVALLNDTIGAAGKTLAWNPVPPRLPVSDPAEVEAALESGVDLVISLGVNPVYDWPGGGFEALLKQATLAVSHGSHLDETLTVSHLALPSSHFLESWNDAAGRLGLSTLCQPVIAPLVDSRQEAESLLRWTQALKQDGDPLRGLNDWHDYLQSRWIGLLTQGGGEEVKGVKGTWEENLRVGGELSSKQQSLPSLDEQLATQLTLVLSPEGEFELIIMPHHTIYDGRFANNGWLQELPDPVSKLVWENAAAMSRGTADGLNVAEGDIVKLRASEKTVRLPVLIQPGMADGVVSTTLGHGRSAGGFVATEAKGMNVAPLLAAVDKGTPRLSIGVQVVAVGSSQELIRTQNQFSMHDRPIVMDGDLEEYRHAADFVKHKRHLPPPVQMNELVDYSKGHKWGMAIDLAACVGCNSCVTACQAENNIPIVGREEVANGREMHWIRLDRYEEGDPDNPRVHTQPMLCQHCDDAPCESVCPVNATSHSPEGLNEMIYNRCVGTRYCANNCPYKVRRFNYLRYQESRLKAPVQELMFNPQVTVRGIGVMEKCTFCVQRINAAKFEAQNAGTPLADGAVQTACQQACPAEAIVFGDANNTHSALAEKRESGRSFHVLEELNVKPNVTYLARVRNPSQKGKSDRSSDGAEHTG